MKGENIVSTALAAIVLLAVLALKSKWNPTDLTDAANSAKEFILTRAGMGGEVPEINGYEPLKVFHLGEYRAGLYRAKPAPQLFAPGRFVIYDQSDQPVYNLDTLEGSKDPWSNLYDFKGRKGLSSPSSRERASYIRDLTGKGVPDIILGQYSGGSDCCTVITILELGKDAVTSIGRIDGLDGMPFEGLEVRRLTKSKEWQCIAHRPYPTACGDHFEAPEVLAVYNFNGEHFEDQTCDFGDYLQDVLRQDLAKWKEEKNRTMELLQTVAVDYAAVGQKDVAGQFFAANLDPLINKLQGRNVDAHACLETLQSLVARVPTAETQSP
jgi:hypothetical protein